MINHRMTCGQDTFITAIRSEIMTYLRAVGLIAGLLLLLRCTLRPLAPEQFRSGPEVMDISNFA